MSALTDLFLKKSNFDSELNDIFLKKSFIAPKTVLCKTVESEQKSDAEVKTVKSDAESKVAFAANNETQHGSSKKLLYDPSKQDRTIFVGNLSLEAIEKEGKKILLSHFSKYGKIQSIRFRSLAFEKQCNRKAAFIKKEFHPKRSTVNAYILFEKKEGAVKSLESNASILFNKHIRVDSAGSEDKDYPKKLSIFIGNLPLDIEEEAIWLHFASCGKVCGVRVVRDKVSSLGKGFGYVLFESPSSVQLALNLMGSTLAGREIRVSRCLENKTKGNLKRPRENLIIEGERAIKGTEKPPKKKASKSSRLRAKMWKGKLGKK